MLCHVVFDISAKDRSTALASLLVVGNICPLRLASSYLPVHVCTCRHSTLVQDQRQRCKECLPGSAGVLAGSFCFRNPAGGTPALPGTPTRPTFPLALPPRFCYCSPIGRIALPPKQTGPARGGTRTGP